MIENQFKQLLLLLNDQTEAQENLTEQLTKANALVALTLSEDFLDHAKTVVHSYLWALSDVVEQAKNLSEQILNALIKGTPTGVTVYEKKGSSRSPPYEA